MPLTTGETILNGKYRIVELLGKGAFAHVYRARHERLQREVAIKTLRRGEEGVGSTRLSAYRDRFQLEAELGAQFDDPHLIRVYDFEEEDGALYLVMEYCPGGSLQKRLEEGPLPIEDAVRMAREVAEGLALLHGHRPQIVHRDLKPSNILLSADGVWKVADLGLAQVSGQTSRRSVLESAADWHPGTPEYMSPEQEEMKGYLQPPSDVWVLGAVLFEALTGQLYKAVRPGTRVRELRSAVPEWLDELVARCLSEDKKTRPWEGGEVAALISERREAPAGAWDNADSMNRGECPSAEPRPAAAPATRATGEPSKAMQPLATLKERIITISAAGRQGAVAVMDVREGGVSLGQVETRLLQLKFSMRITFRDSEGREYVIQAGKLQRSAKLIQGGKALAVAKAQGLRLNRWQISHRSESYSLVVIAKVSWLAASVVGASYELQDEGGRTLMTFTRPGLREGVNALFDTESMKESMAWKLHVTGNPPLVLVLLAWFCALLRR